MKDPFEDFLEDALGGPDLELGHEMRRRLLEAAVAGETIADGNVVRIDRPDPAETAGFDWLVGEAPATGELMGRIVEDPAFMESLDGQRGFILTLREALRRTAIAAAAVPVRRRRRVHAAVLSAAAALAMTTGILISNKPAAPPAENLAASAGTAAPVVPAVRTPAKPIVAAEAISPDTTPAAPAPVPLIPGIASASPPALADPGGTGRSIDPGDPALVPQLGAAFDDGVGQESLPVPILAMLGGTSGGFGEDAASLPLLAGGPSSWSEGGMNGFDRVGAAGTGPGVSLVGPGGGRDKGSIPEPGGALPVMIGLMLLLLRRPQRERAQP